tara:strand:- start:1356 stop:1976 length:621 start_codon:yes stop_codon:yes gene_type:complete
MGARYSVPRSALTTDELIKHCDELTMTPTASGYGAAPDSFCAYALDDNRLSVPRCYGYAQWGAPETVALVEGAHLSVPFIGTLNPLQTTATHTMLERLAKPPHGGMLLLPCGYGKTVCALYIAHKLGRRTLVLVHKSFLVQQWQERVRAFLPGASVGRIQQNTVDADADVVVGMLQSMSRRDYGAATLAQFGTVIIDEVRKHHHAV